MSGKEIAMDLARQLKHFIDALAVELGWFAGMALGFVLLRWVGLIPEGFFAQVDPYALLLALIVLHQRSR